MDLIKPWQTLGFVASAPQIHLNSNLMDKHHVAFFFLLFFYLTWHFEQFLEPLQIVVFNLGQCIKQLYFNPEGQGYFWLTLSWTGSFFFFPEKKGTVVFKIAIPVMILKRRSHQARCQHSLRIKKQMLELVTPQFSIDLTVLRQLVCSEC